MNSQITNHFEKILSHLYINPLEKCNLRCKICYTKKTNFILTNEQIIEFVERYLKFHKIETITFCGGEVFALKNFTDLINDVNKLGIFVQVITNGTIDYLDKIKNPNEVNLIVSLDGLPEYHDSNRGKGNFDISFSFLKKAHKLGFHTEIFSIITKQNLSQIDDFEKFFKKNLGFLPNITYHPRKPTTYLNIHPVSNVVGETENFDFLSDDEMIQIMKTKNVFPPKDLGCYQISLVSDGKVFGCCEGIIPLGKMTDDPKFLVLQLQKRLEVFDDKNKLKNCLGCSQPEFMCGIKRYLNLLNDAN